MSRWYYLQKGRPFGPVSTKELKIEIQARRLSLRDLIFKETDTEWREISKFSELETSSPQPSKQSLKVNPNSDEWVLLIRKNDVYRQLGPFTRSEICSKLQASEIAFTDYVWRKGLKEWYKIIALAEFRLPLSVSKIANDIDINTINTTDTNVLIDFDVTMRTELVEITKKLPLPLDIPLPILPIVEPQVNERHVKFTNKPQAKKINTTSSARRISAVNYYSKLTPTRKFVVVAISTLSMAALLFFITYLSTYRDRKNLKPYAPTVGYIESTTRPAPPALLPTAGLQSDTRDIRDIRDVRDVRVTATYIRAQKEFDGSSNPRIKIQTDGSQHYPITVTLSAEGGSVLYLRSFVRKVRLYNIEDRLLELGKLNLLPGDYDLTLEIEKIKYQLKVSFATQSTADFLKKIKQHRKQIFMYFNNERYNLIKTSDRLEKLTYMLMQNIESTPNPNMWTQAHRSWRREFNRTQAATLNIINGSNRTNYVLASKWLRLKSLRIKIEAMEKGIHRAKISGQTVSLYEIKNTAQEISKLKEETLSDSLLK